MNKQNIAIIGLGRIGSAFLGAMLQKKQSINLVCVAERAETPAKSQAAASGIRIASLDEIVSMGNAIDILFDLAVAARFMFVFFPRFNCSLHDMALRAKC